MAKRVFNIQIEFDLDGTATPEKSFQAEIDEVLRISTDFRESGFEFMKAKSQQGVTSSGKTQYQIKFFKNNMPQKIFFDKNA